MSNISLALNSDFSDYLYRNKVDRLLYHKFILAIKLTDDIECLSDISKFTSYLDLSKITWKRVKMNNFYCIETEMYEKDRVMKIHDEIFINIKFPTLEEFIR